ncbi:hypothetical protein Pd630_LPD04880 [Rhodococcus opacus PD630]|nr:hypothetical protein Pd630_LPD04880 [Rhodococcus opacus PD630]
MAAENQVCARVLRPMWSRRVAAMLTFTSPAPRHGQEHTEIVMVSQRRGRRFQPLHAIRASVGGAACLAGLVIGAMALTILAFPAPGVQAATVTSQSRYSVGEWTHPASVHSHQVCRNESEPQP